MAGFWHLSHHQMRDLNGEIYAAARVSFYEAATLSPITTYQDYGLGTPHANPVVANAYGVFPPVFFDEADGFYRQRITDSGGVIIPGTDVGTLPIIGPGVGGGGAEVPVDENALYDTGDIKVRYGTGTLSGYVRANGRNIGSSTSGATERANADCESLFLFLYGEDTNLSVSGGRGVSAAADWAANKTIALPDFRGCAIAGLDDMGNTAASRLTVATFTSLGPTTLGALAGEEAHTLVTGEMPSHAHTLTDPGHSHGPSGGGTFLTNNGGAQLAAGASQNYNTAAATTTVTTGITMANTGGGTAHNNIQPTRLVTVYIRL